MRGCSRPIGHRRCAAAITTCLFSVVAGLPQKSGSHTLAASSEVTASGHVKMSRAQVAGGVNAGPHVRREVLDEGGQLLQDSARQPVSENLTGHPPTLTVDDAKHRLEKDGLVETYNAVPDNSQAIKLEEETIECMMDTPVWECMKKHGSYGVRRLFTDSVRHFELLNSWRKDWMQTTTVQRKKLFDITWPGTHDSGAYGFDESVLQSKAAGTASAKGSFTQHLDVYTQLSIGVRAIELQIAVGKEDGQLYTANGFLMMSLATVLTDITSFLTSHKNEAILLYMRKADAWNGIEEAHVKPLKDEESNPNSIPGEAVHKGVEAILGKHLATHDALATLPAGESTENPTIQAAIGIGVRVFYFWEGQQVLCLSKEACSTTPGWQRGHLGQPLAFGPGLPYGARTNLGHSVGNKTFIEPGCIVEPPTASSNPIQLLLSVKKYAGALMNAAKTHPPKCFPEGTNAPELHHPQLLYAADVWVSPFSEAEGAYRKVYKDIEEIYTRGESATVHSEAERVNYLALNWLLRKNWQPLFTKLNIISFDYISPIVVHRIVEANQEMKECGFAMYCKSTGSCWSQTLLDEETNTCKDEEEVMQWLQWFADGQPWPWWLWVLVLVLVGCALKLSIYGTVCYALGNNCFPSCCFPGGVGIVWWKRQKKEKTITEEPGSDSRLGQEPEQQQMDDAADEVRNDVDEVQEGEF